MSAEDPDDMQRRLAAHYALMFPGGRDDPEDSDGLATDRALAAAAEAHLAPDQSDPERPRARAVLLVQLQRQVTEGIVAVAVSEGRDPAQALQVDLAQELLADRAADAAQEARRWDTRTMSETSEVAQKLPTDLAGAGATPTQTTPQAPTRVAGEVAPEVLFAELQQWVTEGTAALNASEKADGAAGPRLSMVEELIAERHAEASAEASVEAGAETGAAREADTALPALPALPVLPVSTERAAAPAPGGPSEPEEVSRRPAPSPEAAAAFRARLLQELREVDYVRAVQRWAATGTSRREIVRVLHQNERVISNVLAREDVGVPLPGLAGVGPLEIAKRYAAGELTREVLVAQLVAFPYVKVERDPYDDFSVEPPGTWAEVLDAHGLGYIDLDLYDEVQTRREAERTGETAYLDLNGEPIEPSPAARERARKRAGGIEPS